MEDWKIRELCGEYRVAIEAARDDGAFGDDISFSRFPRGCCGDTCYLLAEYLRSKGVNTIYYSAQRGDWSHAWLVVNDWRVKQPAKVFSCPEEIRSVVSEYGGEFPDWEESIIGYASVDLMNGLIIDITGDQFEDYSLPVYVGNMDSFHLTFELIQAHDYDGLNSVRLCNLFQVILEYLDE